MDDRQPVSLARRALSYLICYLVAVQPMLPVVAAQITPITPGTKMDAAGNGVPVVNIAAPNGAGVSHNQYQQYNVGQEGLILNNATSQLNQTQLGGLIQNNPNLKAGQEAKAIINEVTGANRSQLQGYTEVAGKAANVIVANPYGITCNGCGFINTPNVTLTTGKPQLDANGNLSALDVTRGSVIVEGKGLDGSSADAVAIVARATEINAGIHARDLSVTVGANRVGADGSVTPLAGEGAAPSVAVDTGALGGMYANRIHLVSGEKGVGVNLGNLVAKQGDIQLDANGKLTLSNSLSSGALTANGASVALNGDNKATGQITVSAQQDTTLGKGTLVSDAGIAITAKGNLTTVGSSLTAGRDIRLSGANLNADQSTLVNAGSSIQLQAQSQITNGGQFTAADSLSVGARQLENNGSLAASAINVKAGTLQNSGGASIAATRSLTTVSDRLFNQGLVSAPTLDISSAQTDNSGMLQGTSALSFSGSSLNNLSGGTLSSNNAFALNLPDLSNSGLISSGTTLTLRGDRLNNAGEINAADISVFNASVLNESGGSLLAGQALQLNNRQLTNEGKMAAVKLTLDSDAISNNGTLQAKQTLQTHSQQLTNTGTVLSEDQLTLDTAALSNAGSLQGRLLNVSADSWLNSGKVLSLTDGVLTTGSLNNTGSIFSQQTLQLSSGETDNSGLIQGTKTLRFSGQRLNNLADGTVSSENSLGLDLPELNNTGLISSGAALNLSGGILTNAGEISATDITADNDTLSNQQGGLLLADNAVQLKNGTLANAGQIAAGRLDISTTTVDNSGTLQGTKTLQAAGQQLTNRGTVLSGGQLTLKQDRLDNSGQMQGQQLDLTAGDWQNSGNALSAGDATIAAGRFTNSGKILGQQHIALNAGSTDNSGWLLAQALTLQSDLVNSGLMQGSDALILQGGKLVNHDTGQLLTAGKAEVRGSSLDNQGSIQADQLDMTLQSWENAGSARAGSQLSANVSGALDNSGKLLSEQAMSVLSSQLSNTGTLAADRLTVSAPQLTNAGLLQGNSALSLSSTNITNSATGELITGSSLSLAPVTLTNAGLIQVAGDLSLKGHNLSNSGRIAATSLNAGLDGSLDNSASGLLLAQQQADIQVNTLNNAGTVAAQQVKASGVKLQNQGLLQGDTLLSAEFSQFDNLLHGQLVSGGELSLQGGSASNAGVWQGKNLGYHFTSLFTSGTINGTGSLSGTSDTLDNSGSLLTGGHASVSAGSLTNGGKILADSLTLRGDSLSNRGLWQGTTALDAQAADRLVQSSGGQALTGGDLQLIAGRLETAGTLQGETAHVVAGGWQHQGSLLSSNDLTVSVSGDLNNQGELLAQGTAQIDAQNLNNSGRLLAEKDVTLNGSSLTNSGTIQGDTLAIRPASVTNQGSLIGLRSLTLGPAPARGLRLLALQAQPPRVLVNNAGGQLLTQGTLHISGDAVTNNGTWQGQQILLEATRLANGSAIQSAGDLQLNLSDTLTSGAGSKITANGAAVLTAQHFTHQGQWIAQNLTIQGGTLENRGEISGVNGLTTTLTGALTQQQNAALLSGGTLDVHAATLDNAGRMQGKDLSLSSGGVTNSGRLQGDNNLVVNASGRLTNNTSGTLLSQNGLTLTTPELYNYGLIQGATSRITTSGLASNSGKVLSSADLTLNAPQLVNSGWLQASQLVLNATSVSNSGTLMADQQATLTGNSLQNQGTAQGGNLAVNYAQLTNSGTLLGTSQLNVHADNVTQQEAGRLFSGGNLLLQSTGFDQLGQVVALGDATLNLINSFTARNTLAAGNRLNISSNGAIDNQGTLQGQALTLSAGGDLTNNGQLTTGTGDSSLSGQRINMNGAGTLQGGGNVALTSRSDVALNGFTGTRGNLTITSPGSIVNTALLYAGQNLYLYANSIQNQRGDMLAGNSLWMQRDAAGNANGEVINTSGTIESQNGDININTAHLLNTRDGLKVTQTETALPARAGVGNDTIKIDISELPKELYGYFTSTRTVESGGGCSGADGGCSVRTITTHNYAPLKAGMTQKFAVTSSQTDVVSDGGAARLASGRNVVIRAGSLENQASYILAQQDITVTGDQLNNQSWQAGAQSDNLVYAFKSSSGKEGRTFTYALTGHEISFTPGELYRSVIQAGGNISATFNGDISNALTTSNAGWEGNTLSAPDVKGLASINKAPATKGQMLTRVDVVPIASPAWRDLLQSALQRVNSGGGLDTALPTASALYTPSDTVKGNVGFGKASGLATGAEIIPASLNTLSLKKVDTSAYPVPATDNGYFVIAPNSSPYLITVNPKLDSLGKMNSGLFDDLNRLLVNQPGSPPQETRQQYTDVTTFLGSSYLLDRLNLKPEKDYRFLGDAAFDTRYVSNAVLNQTGNRYLNGMGSDLDQMRYLMDNAASAQQSLGLQFGVSLTAEQVAELEKSIIWWESTSVNGQTVMVPKIYLSPKDTVMNNGSVIAGNNLSMSGGNIVNTGSALTAQQTLSLDSQNRIDNLRGGLLAAGSDLQLSSLGDINNVSATITGKKIALESFEGNINVLTSSQKWGLDTDTKTLNETLNGPDAVITAEDSLSFKAGNNITLSAATLKAGGNVLLDAWNDIAVNATEQTAGQSQAEEKKLWFKKEATRDQSLSHTGSQIAAGGDLTLTAGHDLTTIASSLNGKGDTLLAAGNDLNLNSAESRQERTQGKKTSYVSEAEHTVVSSGGDLTLRAGRDLTSQAAALTAEGDAQMQAGRDINLLARENRAGDSERGGKKTVINETVRQQGTEIASGGNISVSAGNNITGEASDITAKRNIAVEAGNDVELGTASESDYYYKEETKTKKSILRKKTTHTVQEDSSITEKGTLLSGNNVSVSAGNNLLIKGSQVVGDDKVALNAGNNVEITAATNTDSAWRLSETRKTGLMSTGGLGLTIGSSKTLQEAKDKGTTQSQSVSTVGSTAGDVSITAGKQLQVNGADLIAGGNMALKGDSVAITPGHDLRTHDERFEQRTSGLTLALSGAVADAVNTAVTAAQSAKQESDGRLAALQATKAVLSGVQAYQASQLAQGNGAPNYGIGISLSLTTQHSESQQHQASDTVSGSTINAGKNLSIDATGKGNSPESGNLLIAGSQLKAGGDTALHAENDIVLTGSASTQQTTGKNSSSGGGIGISSGIGSGSAGLSIFASVNGARGNEKGSGTVWRETTLDSGGDVSITSGRDTTLSGAQVNGNSVTADVGRNLTLTSLQDSDNYDSKQTSFGAGGSFTPGTVAGSGYINASQDKMHSTYDSVTEQSGIYAGKGGFDITVGHHTQLNGAVIASQAGADKNRLDTGTIGFTDIHNQADYKTAHHGIGISTGASIGGLFAGNMANTLLAGAGNSGHAEGTTQSAVADGMIVVRDQANQQQSLNELSRDTENANDSISPIFNKEKEQKRLQTAQMIGEIGVQVGDIARTQGAIIATRKANEGMASLSTSDLAKAKSDWEKANPGKTAGNDEIARQAWQNRYDAELSATKLGTGSAMQQGIQAVTAAVQGLAGNNIGQAVSGASAPYLAEQIHKYTLGNPEAQAMAHAVVGAIASYASGHDALAGAAGAVSGELMAKLVMGQLYPGKTVDTLSETEKQTVSALSTLAAGLVGATVGGDTVEAVNAAQLGKNAVENNHLSSTQALTFDKELSDCRKSGGDCQAVIEKWKQVSDKQSAETDQKLKDNPLEAQVIDKEVAQGGVDMAERPGWLGSIGADVMTSDEAKAYVQQWNGQDLANIDVNSPEWTKYAAFVSDPENQAAVASLGLLGKDLAKAAISFMSRNTAMATVKASEVGMQWGQGNMKQGMPWEDYVGKSLPANARLPQNFKTFDYYDVSTKTAVSAKTMDTQTMAKLANPNQVYSSIKGNIDAAARFENYSLSGREINSSMITNKEIQLAVPANTTKTQWSEINRAIEYGKSQGVTVKVTQVKL